MKKESTEEEKAKWRHYNRNGRKDLEKRKQEILNTPVKNVLNIVETINDEKMEIIDKKVTTRKQGFKETDKEIFIEKKFPGVNVKVSLNKKNNKIKRRVKYKETVNPGYTLIKENATNIDEAKEIILNEISQYKVKTKRQKTKRQKTAEQITDTKETINSTAPTLKTKFGPVPFVESPNKKFVGEIYINGKLHTEFKPHDSKEKLEENMAAAIEDMIEKYKKTIVVSSHSV
ncbi:MAG: hypothetical protein WC979_01045 [Candidatus Pacearchaeota archaeon]|jgi:hypothetical protein|nr:hypothetical protein [Clostridia bacterium]